uniref:Uncharacterized protein n=1 Tax=Aegilops tauschii subsp. strangulata TaxID=200361 RepID=A0A453IM70_AEGTS
MARRSNQAAYKRSDARNPAAADPPNRRGAGVTNGSLHSQRTEPPRRRRPPLEPQPGRASGPTRVAHQKTPDSAGTHRHHRHQAVVAPIPLLSAAATRRPRPSGRAARSPHRRSPNAPDPPPRLGPARSTNGRAVSHATTTQRRQRARRRRAAAPGAHAAPQPERRARAAPLRAGEPEGLAAAGPGELCPARPSGGDRRGGGRRGTQGRPHRKSSPPPRGGGAGGRG